MKKLLFIGAMLFSLYGCSGVDLEENDVSDDINSIPVSVTHEDALSPNMASAMTVITTGAKEFGSYMNQLNLKSMSSRTKTEAISYISDIKQNVSTTDIPIETNLDKEVYDVLSEYKSNLIKSIEYMISYLETGNIDKLRMQRSYTLDLLENVRELKRFSEKYSF
jgi:hypothetical protein